MWITLPSRVNKSILTLERLPVATPRITAEA